MATRQLIYDNQSAATMNRFATAVIILLGLGDIASAAPAQTPGSVSLTATLGEIHGKKSAKHWTVVWVTSATGGAFVRTIRRQGPGYRSHWGKHCGAWYTAVADNEANAAVAPDGFTSATSNTYAAPDNPFTQTWDCKDADGKVIPDGTYKLWIQYSGDSKTQGPVTTEGLIWTKGPSPSTVKPADQGTNFTGMSIVWKPGATEPVPATDAKH